MHIAQGSATKTISWLPKSVSYCSPGDCNILSLKKCCRLLYGGSMDDTGHNNEGSCLGSCLSLCNWIACQQLCNLMGEEL